MNDHYILALVCVTLFLFATNLIQLLVTRNAVERAHQSRIALGEADERTYLALEEMYKAQALEQTRSRELEEEQRLHRNLLAKNQRKRDRVEGVKLSADQDPVP